MLSAHGRHRRSAEPMHRSESPNRLQTELLPAPLGARNRKEPRSIRPGLASSLIFRARDRGQKAAGKRPRDSFQPFSKHG